MPIERERLIFFGYFHSRAYREFLLEANEKLGSSPLDADSIVKVWEDGFLQFTASQRGHGRDRDGMVPALPRIVDADTGQVQQWSHLDQLSSDGLLTLFSQLVRSGRVLHMMTNDGQRRASEKENDPWSNPWIELLTRRLRSGRWDGAEKFPELRRLIEAAVEDSTVSIGVCLAHELWGTRLWDLRMAVYVDTLLRHGLTVDTEKRVTEVMKTFDALRPSRELIAAFASPAPFELDNPNAVVLHFSTPLLRVLPIGPVRAGSNEHSRLVEFAPLITGLSQLEQTCPRHALCLDRVEWSMEVYRLFVEATRCRNKDSRAIDHLACNRPHLRVPMEWRRTYNKMGIGCIQDLVM